jgi:hypothetical protein
MTLEIFSPKAIKKQRLKMDDIVIMSRSEKNSTFAWLATAYILAGVINENVLSQCVVLANKPHFNDWQDMSPPL